MDYTYHSLFSDDEITEDEFRSELEQLGIDGKHPMKGLQLDKQIQDVLKRFDGTEVWQLFQREFIEAAYEGTGLSKDYLSRLRSRVGAKRRQEVSTVNFSKLIDACIPELDKSSRYSASRWRNLPCASKRQWVACSLCRKLTPEEKTKLDERYRKEQSNDKRKSQIVITATIASMLSPQDLRHLYHAALRAALERYELPIGWGGDDVHALKEYAICKSLIEDPAFNYEEPLSEDDKDALQEDLEQITDEEFLSLLRTAIESEDPYLAEYCLNALPYPVLQT